MNGAASPSLSPDDRPIDDLAGAVGARARDRGVTIAVAESLTGGQLVATLARAKGASDWLRGGVVAYARSAKHDLLTVRPGPVSSAEAATDMATGVMGLLRSELSVATTGVGGPDPQDGEPPGSFWIAVATDVNVRTRHHLVAGPPEEVCEAACRAALEGLIEALDPR